MTDKLELYSKVAQSAKIGVWELDLETNIFYWDAVMRCIHEVPDNFIPEIETVINFYAEGKNRDKIKLLAERAILEGIPFNDKFQIITAKNNIKYVESMGQIVFKNGKPSRLSGTFQDITKEQNLIKELEKFSSIFSKANDAVLITEAEPFDEPGPKIVYVNDAFTRMTGYTAEEVIGKTPRILQGPKSDENELKRLSEALRKWESCEITTVNYKKNGAEFWINLTVSPVADKTGWFTHWTAIGRDISQRKNEELQKTLFADISRLFNEPGTLNLILDKVLDRLVVFGYFSIAEAWLISADKKKINLVSKYCETDASRAFYDENKELKSFAKGEGLPGTIWETKTIQLWQNIREENSFIRRDAAKKMGLQSAYGLPVFYNDEVIAVFVLGLNSDKDLIEDFSVLFENIGILIGAEIKRKQLEQELSQIFSFAPDVICIAGLDGYFKKLNAAACVLLEYTEEELLAVPISEFIHSEDKLNTVEKFEDLSKGIDRIYFENRYITKSGKIKWLAWTISPSSEEGFFFAVAKDITEKKNLDFLINKTNTLARIGSWEVDLVNNRTYWSKLIREIYEVQEDYMPDLETAINFIKEGESREIISEKIQKAIEKDIPFDVELQIVTAKGNEKWIRVIGETEFSEGKCIKIYGSFQGIDKRKRAELSVIETLEEKNTILESIGDAFFAMDKFWTVTYWNNQAEKLIGILKNEIVGHYLWEVFPDSINSKSYRNYHEAAENNQILQFEDYYAPLNKWFEISVYPSNNGLSVYFRDATERKMAEEKLKELNMNLEKNVKQLATSNIELEQFAYVASHDLQEPLRMVTGFLTLLEKKYGDVIDEKGKKYIHFAVDGAKRMRQIILDLLEFSRAGTLEDDQEELDLNELVKEIQLLFRKRIEKKKVIIKFDKLPVIQGHSAPLRQVFQNLISNALKYSKEGSYCEVNITVKEFENHWQFAVIDNGIGIAEEYFDKIFIIFQRLHNKDEYSGTGIGLAVTKKVIENLGGKIWLESTEGKGSTFYFTIKKQQ
ncbi:PAS domain S-box protein [Flavobacterium gawalongense]|uniref:histidine kinase n=1 Tax=Flavobacterium gawalongense TaxID=2594432 RepID=A0A553BKC2_9FLAO|nr:PAS domain S-box protein [Flavobacterium gawalongense]TRX03970.1 PAS domain S-box protein [Flavobacterium gawalongense]TRX07147.1 PAS domain S-box protein [Flavobacterium gawalongense]TRX08679.1 PAS domain S-box protein [Flavobacterium gawalongense]TRX09484.1 PAS domain S-box protein [Flavobacterium gawalongense]TRX25455.1 PAS domain S-box protein [Flavobacterium gawalongense]